MYALGWTSGPLEEKQVLPATESSLHSSNYLHNIYFLPIHMCSQPWSEKLLLKLVMVNAETQSWSSAKNK